MVTGKAPGAGELASNCVFSTLGKLPAIEAEARQYAENKGLKLGKVAQPLRAALSGSTVSPPIFEVAELLGKRETLARIADVAQAR